MKNTLHFPCEKPPPYIRLQDEPVFSPREHLALEKPNSVVTLADLGYDQNTIERSPSPLAITAPFRIFSEQGLLVMQELVAQMKANRNEAAATGQNRLGSYIRGAGYRSQFVRDFCECAELSEFLSTLVGTPVARHSVPAVACGINYAPEDITRAVDTWHVDSVAFDMVILLTSPTTFRGGEFQYFMGTKSEGEALLGGKGEVGTQSDLPAERIATAVFPEAGCGFLQQGNLVFHRACRLLEKADRVTMIPSFVTLTTEKTDGTNVAAMSRWEDPGILTELARHEAWLAREHLRLLLDDLPLTATPEQIADTVESAVGGLNRYAANLRGNTLKH